jgi:hypothetical protein
MNNYYNKYLKYKKKYNLLIEQKGGRDAVHAVQSNLDHELKAQPNALKIAQTVATTVAPTLLTVEEEKKLNVRILKIIKVKYYLSIIKKSKSKSKETPPKMLPNMKKIIDLINNYNDSTNLKGGSFNDSNGFEQFFENIEKILDQNVNVSSYIEQIDVNKLDQAIQIFNNMTSKLSIAANFINTVSLGVLQPFINVIKINLFTLIFLLHLIKIITLANKVSSEIINENIQNIFKVTNIDPAQVDTYLDDEAKKLKDLHDASSEFSKFLNDYNIDIEYIIDLVKKTIRNYIPADIVSSF